jgi:hypothetical protein
MGPQCFNVKATAGIEDRQQADILRPTEVLRPQHRQIRRCQTIYATHGYLLTPEACVSASC